MSSRLSRLGGAAARGVALLVIATCTSDHVPTAPPHPQTAPVTPTPVSAAITASPQAVQLIGAGNIARCDRTNDEATALLLDAYPDATVFTAGDNINGNGSLNNFNTCYDPSWGRHKARTRPAVGEKDYKTAGAAGFFQYFGAAGGDSGKYYYSYDLGAWHIMALNDQISMVAGSPQEQWLRTELANNTKKCTLAYWHRPRFNSSGTNNLAAVKPLWDALYAYSADVVVNAHSQVYERFAPQSPTAVADPAKGMRQFTVGTGGLNLDNFGAPRPNSEVRSSGAYGVLLLTLDTLNYSWQFIPIAGQTFTDAGSTACHAYPRRDGRGPAADGEHRGGRDRAARRDPARFRGQSADGPHGRLDHGRRHDRHGGFEWGRDREGRGWPGDHHRDERGEERHGGRHRHAHPRGDGRGRPADGEHRGQS